MEEAVQALLARSGGIFAETWKFTRLVLRVKYSEPWSFLRR